MFFLFDPFQLTGMYQHDRLLHTSSDFEASRLIIGEVIEIFSHFFSATFYWPSPCVLYLLARERHGQLLLRQLQLQHRIGRAGRLGLLFLLLQLRRGDVQRETTGTR